MHLPRAHSPSRERLSLSLLRPAQAALREEPGRPVPESANSPNQRSRAAYPSILGHGWRGGDCEPADCRISGLPRAQDTCATARVRLQPGAKRNSSEESSPARAVGAAPALGLRGIIGQEYAVNGRLLAKRWHDHVAAGSMSPARWPHDSWSNLTFLQWFDTSVTNLQRCRMFTQLLTQTTGL